MNPKAQEEYWSQEPVCNARASRGYECVDGLTESRQSFKWLDALGQRSKSKTDVHAGLLTGSSFYSPNEQAELKQQKELCKSAVVDKVILMQCVEM